MPFSLLPLTRGGQLEAAGVKVNDGWELLSEICTRVPLRCIGSPGEREQAHYIAGHLDAVGLASVRVEPVPCLGCEVGPCELRVGGPEGQKMDALPVAFTGATPPAGVAAPLTYADDIEFVDFAAPALRGKILLVFGWFGDFSTTKYYRAAAVAGLAGVVVIRDSDQVVSYGLPPAAAGCGNLPVVSVSHATGLSLLRNGAGRAFLRVDQTIRETTGSNVVGVLPANRERIDNRTFLVSAHLDAAPVRPAAADNAAGTAMAVEVMRTLARVKRGRDIWFAGYTDEEYGFSGSRHFAEAHAGMVGDCQCQFYYGGHGTAAGVNRLVVTGPKALGDFMRGVAFEIGHPMHEESRANSLDPVVLYAAGVPSVQVERHPQRTWHTQHDSMEDLAPQALRGGIHLYAEALYRLANAAEIPFPRAVDEAARAASRRRLGIWVPKTLAEAGQWCAHV